MTPRVIILAGYGLNCEEETLHAFEANGAEGKIVHINDVIASPSILSAFQILAIPGGFSYGDDTGSGNAFARKLENHLRDALLEFHSRDTLMLGICNGCQILTKLGFVGTADEVGTQTLSLSHNVANRYQCRWVHLRSNGADTAWIRKDESYYIPVAHGEGQFVASEETIAQLQSQQRIALHYTDANGNAAAGKFPANPNGSPLDIAGITDHTGRVLAMMPHPERGMYSWQRNDYTALKDAALRKGTDIPDTASGMQLFANAVRYFS